MVARVVDASECEVEIRELRVRPCRMLSDAVAFRSLQRVLPALFRLAGFTAHLKQQRPAPEGREVRRDRHHLLVGGISLVVPAEAHVGITEHAVRIRLLRLQWDRLPRKLERLGEVVLYGVDVREQRDAFVVAVRTYGDRPCQCVFRELDLGDIAGLARALQVLLRNRVEAEHVERVAGGARLLEEQVRVALLTHRRRRGV